jgi:ABC-2 type transport system permease protein
MTELRAALAIAAKDLRQFRRYPLAFVAWIFTSLYQGVIPAFLFGAAFAVGGRAVGLEAAVGSDDLAGFIFMGGVIGGLTSVAFWSVAFSFRNEMEQGTLEASWLTPTRHETLVVGRALGAVVPFVLVQTILFAFGVAFFGLRVSPSIVFALPAVVLAVVAMTGVAYALAAAVLLLKEANIFIDTTQYLFSITSGTAFPITLLPLVLQPIALLLPTTYAVDLLRQQGLGARPLFDPAVEYAALIALTVLSYPIGRLAFAGAERRLRRTGALSQH